MAAEKDPRDVLEAYDAMMVFVSNADQRFKMAAEMDNRGVKALTFFDVVLDFILMDAFEDLTDPPSSVVAVINNRWLSNGFKEGVRAPVFPFFFFYFKVFLFFTLRDAYLLFLPILMQALATAVWSVLKAKRRKLLYPDGFISHFYGIMEHLSPVLAWGNAYLSPSFMSGDNFF